MTFKELQNKIIQTRKARRGVKNRIDYFDEEVAIEDFYTAVYKRALAAANAVVKHYEDKGEFDPKDKPVISWTGVKKK